MARINNLTNFLNDVSSAIKQKTGDNTPIPASDFDTEILSIETGGNYQSKTLNVTQNGNYNLLPDQEFDALSNVNISVSVSPVLQNKTVTENGSYTADQNYDGLGTVIVNVPQEGGSGDVKLFETEQAMQADPNPSEGDLAIIYRDATQPVQEESEFSSCIFPQTVVLNEAFTGNVYGRFRPVDGTWFEGMVYMSSSNFGFDGYGNTGEMRVEYESQDGITYTRTDGGEELQEFGTVIKYEPMEPWNNVIGNFMKIGGKYFDGLYEYALNQPVDSFKLREQSGDNYNLVARSNPGMDAFYSGETIFCGKNVGNKLRKIIDLGIRGFVYLSQDLSVAYFVPTQYQNMYIYNNRWAPLVFNASQTPTDVTYYSYDLTNMSRTEVVVSVANLGAVTQGKVLDLPANSYYLLGLVNSSGTYYRWDVSGTSYYQMYIVGSGTEIEYENKYIIASTQFSADESDLFSGMTAYSKKGIITGDGTVANKIGLSSILNDVSGINTQEIDLVLDNENRVFPTHGITLEKSNSDEDDKHNLMYMYRSPNQQFVSNLNNQNYVLSNIVYNSEVAVSTKLDNTNTNHQIILRKINIVTSGDTYEDVIEDVSTPSNPTAYTLKCIQATNDLAFIIIRLTFSNQYRLMTYRLKNNLLEKIDDRTLSATIENPSMFDAIYSNNLYIGISTAKTNIQVYVSEDDSLKLLTTINFASNYDYHHEYIIGKANEQVYIGGMKAWGGDSGTYYHKVLHINSLTNDYNLISKSFSSSQSGTWFIGDDFVVLYNGDNLYIMPYVAGTGEANMAVISPTDIVMSKTTLRGAAYGCKLSGYYDINNSKMKIISGLYAR